VVICVVQGADLHTAQLMPLPLTSSCFSKIQIGLPFWYRLTRVVPEKGPLNGCLRVCVRAHTLVLFTKQPLCPACFFIFVQINDDDDDLRTWMVSR